ncbi:MAG: serine/threonine protein kinase [Planctomycetes bacterium]|nr:serine/threonine protein kinase [Planctomycetota bacterium]
MDPTLRFEISATIAQGDFATVYRARDRELGRDVAIKQIHDQYLRDPRQLERYWLEAQLLAKLEHPHITTIYDIVREKGWLVLELMQGSLTQMLGGRPIDLSDLRMAILFTAQALQYLEQHGIYHGDVKPSNLLVDKNNRIKLGDFGIARRITGEHGSVVKGTTKYMAPEVASDMFGPVGPHSDLYSLGFSAYELMCGENFESLFPGLNVFGRDRQIAWMMWHSAPDRRLPEIARVLQGVPDDLAYVIQRLCEKDPTRRYATARQVIEDLKQGATSAGPSREELAAREQEQRRAVRRRRWAIGACLGSVALSLAMFLIPGGTTPSVAPQAEQPAAGTLISADSSVRRLYVRLPGEPKPHSIPFESTDRLFLNDEPASLDALQAEDELRISYGALDGKPYKEIRATRPLEMTSHGHVLVVEGDTKRIRLAVDDDIEESILVHVPDRTPVTINEQSTESGRELVFTDLRKGDELRVPHAQDHEGRRIARALRAVRQRELAGFFESATTDPPRLELIVPERSNRRESLKLAEQVIVSINGVEGRDGVAFSIADLRAGDRLRLVHDVQVRRVEATREVVLHGAIARLDFANRNLQLRLSGDLLRDVRLAPQCELQIDETAGEFRPGTLRIGDSVVVHYETLANGDLQATSLQATRADDPRTWVVILAQSYREQTRLPPLPHALADASALRAALRESYRVPLDQILYLEDASRLTFEQELAKFLARVRDDAQLVVFYSGHARMEGRGDDPAGGGVVLISAEDESGAATAGWPLAWLVAQLDKTSAREKLMLLDSCHPASDDAARWEPSAAEQLESLREGPGRPIAKSVHLLGSCERSQRGQLAAGGTRGLFGVALEQAWRGAADADGDLRLSFAELTAFMNQELARTSAAAGTRQNPVAYLPDTTPPRLTPAARRAVRQMLAHLKEIKFEEIVMDESRNIESLSPEQPDLKLAFALTLLRHGRLAHSLPIFERLTQDYHTLIVAHQALAWQHFTQGKLREGVRDLEKMIAAIPLTPPSGAALRTPAGEAYVEHVIEFAGQLKVFALQALDRRLNEDDFQRLDELVTKRGSAARTTFESGAAKALASLEAVDKELAETNKRERRQILELERKRISYYTNIQFDAVSAFIIAGLNE